MNKYYCLTITFWDYLKSGLKDAFSNKKPIEHERFPTKIIKILIAFLISIVMVGIIFWVVEKLNILSIFSNLCSGFFIFAFIVDSLYVLFIIFRSWNRAVKDCWDKFQKI